MDIPVPETLTSHDLSAATPRPATRHWRQCWPAGPEGILVRVWPAWSGSVARLGEDLPSAADLQRSYGAPPGQVASYQGIRTSVSARDPPLSFARGAV